VLNVKWKEPVKFVNQDTSYTLMDFAMLIVLLDIGKKPQLVSAKAVVPPVPNVKWKVIVLFASQDTGCMMAFVLKNALLELGLKPTLMFAKTVLRFA